MSGPKRNPDRLNTIGVVVVGICGAVLVYVTIVALQAFYVNDTSEIQTMADYGGQDTGARSLRTEQVSRVSEYGTNPRPAAAKANEAQRPQTYRVPVDVAMKLVVEGARTQPGSLIPALGPSDRATVLPIFGRPKLIPAPATPATPAAAPATAPAAGAAGGGSPAGSGTLPAAPMVPTGTGTGPSPVGGAGALDKPATPGTPGNPTGPTANQPAAGATAAGTATQAGQAGQAGSNARASAPAAPSPAPAAAPRTPAGTAPKGNGK
jgi:hypothetical protein